MTLSLGAQFSFLCVCRSVDSHHIFFTEEFSRTLSTSGSLYTIICQLLNLFLRRMDSQLFEICRHSDRTIEGFHGLNSGKSNLFIGSILFNACYIDCKSLEPRQTALVDVSRPAWPESGETRHHALHQTCHQAHAPSYK